MFEKLNNNPIYILGDVHGRWGDLKDLVEKQDLRDCYLICVGDYGIGFDPSAFNEIERQRTWNEYYKSRNIQFYSIRGNHDDPVYFSGGSRIVFSNLELLEDYTYLDFNGEKFLFVGGAVSIDRRLRAKDISYWEGEEFVLKPEKIEKCDVLITHSAPSWLGPFDKDGLKWYLDRDEGLWDECVKERKEIAELAKLASPSKLYCGHFHGTYFIDFQETYGYIIPELGLQEHRKRE